MPDQIQYEIEMLAYAEKIALAELEVSKAEQRAEELRYEQARFRMNWYRLCLKQQPAPQK